MQKRNMRVMQRKQWQILCLTRSKDGAVAKNPEAVDVHELGASTGSVGFTSAVAAEDASSGAGIGVLSVQTVELWDAECELSRMGTVANSNLFFAASSQP
jgi:hypothetical protein